MWKYFTHRETLTFLHVLQDLVESYNITPHRTIGWPPTEVTWANQTTVSKRLYGRSGPTTKCRFQPGDRVRLSKAKRTFNWTEELLTTKSLQEGRRLQDRNDPEKDKEEETSAVPGQVVEISGHLQQLDL